MELERTFYKLLILGLLTVTVYKAGIVYSGIVTIIEYNELLRTSSEGKFALYVYAIVDQLLRVTGPFLIWLCATYWVPKTIKKFFPEVS